MINTYPQNQNDKNIDIDTVALANEITRYLQNHPQSADTLDGIVKWWLLRQRYRDTTEKVSHALSYLQKKGVLKKKRITDGTYIYSKKE